jgi:RNA polymerase sigma factor (sigma-70 family)
MMRSPDRVASAARDDELIAACLAGDQGAWRELVGRYSRLVLAVPRQCGLDGNDAEDVFQEVFAALLRQLGQLRSRQSLAKWLITTAHRSAWRRYSRRGRCAELDAGIVAPGEPPAELVERMEREHLVRSAVRRMGGRCERLLTALYLEGCEPSYEQVAQRLGIPRGSIGPARARCLAKLVHLLRSAGAPAGAGTDSAGEGDSGDQPVSA